MQRRKGVQPSQGNWDSAIPETIRALPSTGLRFRHTDTSKESSAIAHRSYWYGLRCMYFPSIARLDLTFGRWNCGNLAFEIKGNFVEAPSSSQFVHVNINVKPSVLRLRWFSWCPVQAVKSYRKLSASCL